MAFTGMLPGSVKLHLLPMLTVQKAIENGSANCSKHTHINKGCAYLSIKLAHMGGCLPVSRKTRDTVMAVHARGAVPRARGENLFYVT